MARKITLVVMLILLFLPLYWMGVSSVSTGRMATKVPPNFFPTEFTLDGYHRLFTYGSMVTWLANTVVLMAMGTSVSVLAAVAAGFALSVRPRGWKIVVGCMVAGLLVPRTALTVPMFVEVVNMGLSGTLVGAALPLVYFPVGTIIAMGYFRGIPKELFEEARLSGASDADIIRYVAIPSAGPVVGLLVLTKGIESTGDYLWQSLVLRTDHSFTYIVGILETVALTGNVETKSPLALQNAAAVLLFLPFLVIYLFTARYFTQDPLKGLR